VLPYQALFIRSNLSFAKYEAWLMGALAANCRVSIVGLLICGLFVSKYAFVEYHESPLSDYQLLYYCFVGLWDCGIVDYLITALWICGTTKNLFAGY